MSDNLVCICIPNYNNEKTISQTLDTLLNQTYKNIIIKIFDNVSTDNSFEILKQYESKYNNIQVFQHEENIGAEANFTKCIEGLEGDYGAIYHSDDIYHPTMVEKQVHYLSNNNISAVFTRANLIDENSKEIGEAYYPEELMKQDYNQFDFKELFSLVLKYDNFLITPSVMAKVSIYKNEIKAWNGAKFKTSADLDVWLRFSEIDDIGIITQKLISYRVSTSSYSYRTKFSRDYERDMFLVIEHYLKKYNTQNFNQSDYAFLKFKDNLIVIGNKILSGKDITQDNIFLLDGRLFSQVIQSKQKFKVYIYGLLLKVFIVLGLESFALKLIKFVNSK